MIHSGHSSKRIIIVGGGLSGLAIAARLAQAGLPVTLLEASKLGFAASTRNQGWLYSGAWFARQQTDLAKKCYATLKQTERLCPDCIEPQHNGMAFIASKPDTPIADWEVGWQRAGIPFEEMSVDTLLQWIPSLRREQVKHAFLLPDRAIRPDVLLTRLATVAENSGAEIRINTSIASLIKDDDCVKGVITTTGEEITARFVILATGATGASLWSQVESAEAGSQSNYTRVALKTHLVAIEPELGRLPICVLDEGGFNHIPHRQTSVFGSNRWAIVSDPNDQEAVESEINNIWENIDRFFGPVDRDKFRVTQWAGTTVAAINYDQVNTEIIPWPTVIDHADEAPTFTNLLSVYPGRASLWAELAEQTRQIVLEKLEATPTSTAVPPWAVDD